MLSGTTVTEIPIGDFRKIDLRVGKIVGAENHPNADRLLVLKVDVGGGEVRQIVAGIKSCYEATSLVGRNAIIVCNLQPAKLRGVDSNGMLLAATHEGTISALTPDKDLPPGSKVS